MEAMRLFQSETFDLVLLDLMLPRMDGFGVCELIRQRSQVPILMLTALDGEETVSYTHLSYKMNTPTGNSVCLS